jgi:hypothetical protein
MNQDTFKPFTEKFFKLENLRCPWQSKAAQALVLWCGFANKTTDIGYILPDTLKERCLKTLTAKSKEYSTDADKLKNFKDGAEVDGKTPLEVAQGWQLKHEISIYDISAEPNRFSASQIDEKFGDYINYCCLCAAIVEENNGREDVTDIVGFLNKLNKEDK